MVGIPAYLASSECLLETVSFPRLTFVKVGTYSWGFRSWRLQSLRHKLLALEGLA